MTAGLIQTLWADVIACTLRDAGVPLVVISPGSRSTPLVAALDRAAHPNLVTIIDERAAAFYALGAARATGKPAALVCTSGSAVAHYLPAFVEAAHAGIPLIAITADRPAELQHCGASQTIDQRAIYGGFSRGSYDLGSPSNDALAMRAVRRTMIQAITQALGPDPGPVHVNVPLKKPLEPAQPSTDAERALAADLAELLAAKPVIAPPTLAPDPRAIEGLARAIANEPRGLIVAGALGELARESIFELARRTGYPIVAEAGSQLRFTARPTDVVFVDAFDIIATHAQRPRLIIQLGAEPVAAAWPAFLASCDGARYVLAGARWHDADSSAIVILGDVSITARAIGNELAAVERTSASLRRRVERDAASTAWREDWAAHDRRGREALARAIRETPGTEVAVMRDALAALPGAAALQIGNSLPIRVVDHASAAVGTAPTAPDHPRSGAPEHHVSAAVGTAPTGPDHPRSGAPERHVSAAVGTAPTGPDHPRSGALEHHVSAAVGTAPTGPEHPRSGALERSGMMDPETRWHGGLQSLQWLDNTIVLTQRGAAGIDGLIASAAGSTHAGRPVLLVLGDVSFAHDLGGLLAARAAVAPLAILVIDNAGGRIFDGLPIAKSNLDGFAKHWTTPPEVDVVAVARALGFTAMPASPETIGYDVTTALSEGVTVIHAPVSPTGARDVRARAIELATPPARRVSQPAIRTSSPALATGERP